MNYKIQKLLFFLIIVFTCNCKKKDDNALPQLTTADAIAITQTTALCGGTVTSDGGASVIARGVCWGTNQMPTTANAKTNDGSGTGNFTSAITGLTPHTAYYARAYATNSLGTSYGDAISFTTLQQNNTVPDIDGNVYNTVTIGTQVWMKENLKVTRYNNGDLIGTTTPATLDISSQNMPKYQWALNGNENNIAVYGRLYTWYAITDSRKVCPVGWHVPSDAEWTTLTNYLINNGYGYGGSGNDIGKSMAAASGWDPSSIAGNVGNDQTSNNSSGFTALPGKCRSETGEFWIRSSTYFWTSTTQQDNTKDALNRCIYNDFTGVDGSGKSKIFGLSVRCVKD